MHNELWLKWLLTEIPKLGLEVTPSVGNFVLIHFAKGDKRKGAVAADAFLKTRGIIVRRVAGYGLPDSLRMTIGTESDNRAVLAAPLRLPEAGRAMSASSPRLALHQLRGHPCSIGWHWSALA